MEWTLIHDVVVYGLFMFWLSLFTCDRSWLLCCLFEVAFGERTARVIAIRTEQA